MKIKDFSHSCCYCLQNKCHILILQRRGGLPLNENRFSQENKMLHERNREKLITLHWNFSCNQTNYWWCKKRAEYKEEKQQSHEDAAAKRKGWSTGLKKEWEGAKGSEKEKLPLFFLSSSSSRSSSPSSSVFLCFFIPSSSSSSCSVISQVKANYSLNAECNEKSVHFFIHSLLLTLLIHFLS